MSATAHTAFHSAHTKQAPRGNVGTNPLLFLFIFIYLAHSIKSFEDAINRAIVK